MCTIIYGKGHQASVVMNDGCAFCRILSGNADATFVYRDDRVSVFADIFPIEAGHLLVVPNKHIENIYGLAEDLAGHLFSVTTRVAATVKQVMKPDGVTLLQANERAGGQDVFHFHIHIVPRRAGRPVLRIGVDRQRPSRGELDRLFEPLRLALS